MFSQSKVDDHQIECEKNKTSIPSGPWTSEVNREEFEHAGLNCLLVRHSSLLHWCCYVGVPPGHPAHGKDYDDVHVDVHGGLTYSEMCNGFICHKPKDGKPDNLYWLGADFAHLGDISPGASLRYLSQTGNDTYKDINYVREVCKRLAEQVSKMTLEPQSAKQ